MDLQSVQLVEQQAALLIHQQCLAEAEVLYRQLIAQGAGSGGVYANLAAICGADGRLQDAADLLRQSLQINPEHPQTYCNLGYALTQLGQLDEAIAWLQKARHLSPDLVTVHLNLGCAWQAKGDLETALAAYGEALRCDPGCVRAYLNSGQIQLQRGDHHQAHTCYREALRLDAKNVDAYNGLASVLREQGELEAAMTQLQQAHRLHPNHANTHCNLAICLQEQARPAEAIRWLQAAIRLDPRNPEFHWNLAAAYLASGDYQRGWPCYSWRFARHGERIRPHARPSLPQWQGEPLAAGTPLLLVSEQGLGDTLQFIRYVLVLRQRGLQVSVCVPTKLHGLLQASGLVPEPLTSDVANRVTAGYWIPMLSLPQYLGVSPEDPLITEPYIRPRSSLIEQWRLLLAKEQRPLIGINWQGNPDHERSCSRGRSLPLESFAPLAQHSSATLLSLQKGFGSEQRLSCSFRDRFVSCQDAVDDTWDFEHTAALIANCDLIVSSDTAVAHLAAAMGKTTWLLLKYSPEWRWGMQGESSFWYPSMRLFRQRQPGDWADVLQRVAQAIQLRQLH